MGIFGRTKAAKEHKDPVCGMVVLEERAVGPDTIQGEAVWYCSASCQDRHRERTGSRRQEKAQGAR